MAALSKPKVTHAGRIHASPGASVCSREFDPSKQQRIRSELSDSQMANRTPVSSPTVTGFQTGSGQTVFTQKGHKFLTVCHMLL